MSLKDLYGYVPPALQDLALSAYGLRLRLQRHGADYERHKRWLRETESLPLAELKAIQNAKLATFVRFAARTPFYARAFADVDLDAVRRVADLDRLPVLEKEAMRRHLADFRTGWSPRDVHVHTGGTTGTPMEVVFWQRDFQHRMAMLDYYREQWGFRNGMRRATFSGRTIIGRGSRIFWRHNAALAQRLYSTFHLTEENLPAYVEDLRRFCPALIDGFPTAIVRIARFMERRGIRLDPPPLVVFSTSEALYDFQRETIERAFGCRAANQYASAEGAPFVVECPRGSLHYDLRSGVIEPRPEGDVLVTSFTTHGTPLVRYAIGDRVDLLAERRACGCGNNNPLAAAIHGRHQDFLVSKERGMVAVGLVDIFKKAPPIFRLSQIVQRELDKVDLYLVADDARAARDCFPVLESELRKRLGDGIAIEMHLVDGIETEPSGKYRYIKNLLPEELVRRYS